MRAVGGGISGAHVEADHVANLLIGLAVANPATTAGAVVPLYTSAASVGGAFKGNAGELFPVTVRNCSGELGWAIGDLINELATPTAREVAAMSVVVGRNPENRAFGEVYLMRDDKDSDPVIRKLGLYVGEVDRGRGAMGRFQLATTIPATVFAAAATLVARGIPARAT